MDIQFEIGDPLRPRGHALLYFRVDTEPDHVYGTYIVTLPITADLTKYVPPFLAAHLGSSDTGPLANFAAFAMPPMSELVEGGHDRLVRLANLRSDDLVYGGNMFSYDLARMMESVAGAVQEYADAWNEAANAAGAGVAAVPTDDIAIPLAGGEGGRRVGGGGHRRAGRQRSAVELYERGATGWPRWAGCWVGCALLKRATDATARGGHHRRDDRAGSASARRVQHRRAGGGGQRDGGDGGAVGAVVSGSVLSAVVGRRGAGAAD